MKTRTLLLTIFAIMAIGCSTRDDVNVNSPKKILDYRDSITDVVYENPELFGNILILDSLEEAYELLEHWSTLSYQDLRTEYSQYGFYSKVIESHIIYDSLFHIYMERYGLDDSMEAPSEMLSDMGNEGVLSNYSDIISIQTIYDNELEHDICLIEPIGDFNLGALTNEHGIFIADSIVYKLYPNGNFLSFFLSAYPQLAGYEYEAIFVLQASGEYDDLIPDLPQVYVQDYYNHYNYETLYPKFEKVLYNDDKQYRLDFGLYAHARTSWFYGTTTLYVEFMLKNYKLGWFGWFYWLTKLPTSIDYNYDYEAYQEHNPNDIQRTRSQHYEVNCRKFFKRDIIDRFAYGDFAYPTCGFINYGFDVSNGYAYYMRSRY